MIYWTLGEGTGKDHVVRTGEKQINEKLIHSCGEAFQRFFSGPESPETTESTTVAWISARNSSHELNRNRSFGGKIVKPPASHINREIKMLSVFDRVQSESEGGEINYFGSIFRRKIEISKIDI